jgi:hypothetical protein
MTTKNQSKVARFLEINEINNGKKNLAGGRKERTRAHLTSKIPNKQHQTTR